MWFGVVYRGFGFKPFRILWFQDLWLWSCYQKQIFVLDLRSLWLSKVWFVAPEMAPTVRNGKMSELRGLLVLSWCNVGFSNNLLLPFKSFSDHRQERSFKIISVETKCQAFTVTTLPIDPPSEITGMCSHTQVETWYRLRHRLRGRPGIKSQENAEWLYFHSYHEHEWTPWFL